MNFTGLLQRANLKRTGRIFLDKRFAGNHVQIGIVSGYLRALF